MPSTRRTLLRTGLLGVVGTLAGCSTDRNSSGTEATSTTDSTVATSTTIGQTSDETTTERPTTVASPPRAIEFAHRDAVLDSGITDADSDFFARRIGIRQDAADLDLSVARETVPEQDVAAVEEFVTTTNFQTTTLLAVQVRTPSPKYGLGFSFLDPGTPPQVVVGSHTKENRGGRESEDAISTLLIRTPARTGSPLITIADLAGVRDDSKTLTSFEPPNALRSEARTVAPLDGVSAPSAVVATSEEDARRLLPESDAYAEFVRETDFERTHLLAAQIRIRSGGVFAWPAVVAQRDGHAVLEIWRHPFTGGPNAEFDRLLLARIQGEAPESGTATIQRYGLSGGDFVRFTSDPAEWPNSGGDKSK
ncbi:hypothetical protein BRD15_10310 [Halobacteriales archaeon SW_6_65_15]|nr:MAG: hypothetical protein BRD15_10310 [Halobacteriales archaeon SW_6_65_15]